MKRRIRLLRLILICIFIPIIIFGCNGIRGKGIFGEHLKDNEVFRVGDSVCSLSELKLYLITQKNQYQGAYGDQIWTLQIGKQTLQDSVKQNVISQLAQIKTMCQFAKEKGVSLSDEEKNQVNQAAAEFFSGLSDEEKKYLGIGQSTVEAMYSEYLLADRVYKTLTSSIETEVSDDEARVLSVQQIVLKASTTKEDGTVVTFSNEQKKEIYEKAKQILERAKNGEDFSSLAKAYNEIGDYQGTYGRNTMPEQVEDIVFNLENGQISGIIETEQGYYIVKCINSYDKDATDVHKKDIVEQRKSKAFDAQYEEYSKKIKKVVNHDLCNKFSIDDKIQTNTTNFFDIYNNYFSD